MKNYFAVLGNDEPSFDPQHDAAMIAMAKGRELQDDGGDAPSSARPPAAAKPVTARTAPAAPAPTAAAAPPAVQVSAAPPVPAASPAVESGAVPSAVPSGAPAAKPASRPRATQRPTSTTPAATVPAVIPDPFAGLAAPATVPPAASFGVPAGAAVTQPPPGLNDSAVVVHETHQGRAVARLFRSNMTPGVMGILTRGDDPVSVAAPKQINGAEALRAMGFPDRPQTWPSFIAWPPQAIVDRFQAPDVTALQRQEMIAALLELEERFLERSRQINAWFEKHNPSAGQDKHSQTVTRRSGNDPHYGIKWATLINPGVQDRAIASTVLTWGHGLALTADGGALRVHDDVMSFSGKGTGPLACTPQLMMLAIQEARNRGWSKIELSGSFEFGQLAIKAAKEAGIEADITYYGKGMRSWKAYKVKVMPNAPMPLPQADPSEKTTTEPKAKPRNIDAIAYPPLVKPTGPAAVVSADQSDEPVELVNPATDQQRERERASPSP